MLSPRVLGATLALLLLAPALAPGGVAAEPVSASLSLASSSVTQGGSLSGTIVVKNAGASWTTLSRVTLAARPPGGTNAGGPYEDFGSVSSVSIAPGESKSFTFSRAFDASDPAGAWYAYPALRLASGEWVDGARVAFTVGSSSIVAAARLSGDDLARGQTVVGTVTVKNAGASAVTLPRVTLAARPPGGTNAGGPFLDVGSAANVWLAAGQSKTITFSRALGSADPTGDWHAFAAVKLPDGRWLDAGRVAFRVSAAATGPAIVKATASGFTVNGRDFVARGVAFSPTPVGKVLMSGYDWYDDPVVYNADLPRIRAMGANVLRVYHVPSWNPSAARAFLDAAHANGLKVIVGDWAIGGGDASSAWVRDDAWGRVTRTVDLFKDHPAVLTWMIGNEIDANYGGGDVRDWYRFLDALAVEVKRRDPNHPVSSAFTAHERLAYFPWACPHVDVYSVNSYELAPGGLANGILALAREKIPGKPVLVSEFGADAWDSDRASEYGSAQSALVLRQWSQIAGASNAAGGVVFEWVDEWHKKGDPWTHNGAKDWTSPSAQAYLPDDAFSEEWFGIARQSAGSTARSYRPAYYALRSAWTLG